MTSELNLKRILINKAIDVILRGAQKSPKRCARNLTELGMNAFPNKLTKDQKKQIYEKFFTLCKNNEIKMINDVFFSVFSFTH